MAIDNTIAIRRGMLQVMKADAAVTAIVPGGRIYPQTTPALPAFPFVRMGAPSSLPLRASCLDGGTWLVAVHGFAKDRLLNGTAVETAEDHAGRLGAAIAAALDGQRLAIVGGSARIRWRGGQLLMDPDESGCFHSIQNFEVRAITA